MYEGFDDDQLKLIKAQKTTSANAPGVVQVTSGPDESQEPAPGTMEFMPVKTFTSSKPVRDPKTGGITSAFSKDFRSGKVLGTGGFAVVKQCTHIKSGKPYAVKVMNIAPDIENEEEIDGMTLPEIAEEIRLTMAMAHPQVVRIYDFYQTDTKVYVVMELLRGGELLDAVMELGHYTELDAVTVMKQLFTGLISIHAQNITHRDLKLENLILAESGNLSSLRIADFGLAKKMKTSRGKLSAQCGSPGYVAPEVILGQQYTPAVDMWAAGCIMYGLLCGELPFYEKDEQAMFRRIAKAKMHLPSEEISESGLELLNALLCLDKVTRLTAAEALEHRWVTGESSRDENAGGSTPISRSRMQKFAEKHAWADALQTRELQPGDLLIKQGARATEIFLIKEGSCEVIVTKDDGTELKVAERHAGEFVGEMGVKLRADGDYDCAPSGSPTKSNSNSPSKKNLNLDEEAPPSPTKVIAGKAMAGIATLLRVKNKWVGGRRGADVRATTAMKVVVMTADQMQWVLEHDYGADGEVTNTIKIRKAELEKKKSGKDSPPKTPPKPSMTVLEA